MSSDNITKIDSFYQSDEFFHLSHTLNDLPVGLVAWDGEQKIRIFNQDSEKIFGYKSDEIQGANVNRIFSQVLPSFCEMGSQSEISQKVEGVKRDGDKFQAFVEIRACSLRNQSNAILKIAHIHNLQDIHAACSKMKESRFPLHYNAERPLLFAQCTEQGIISSFTSFNEYSLGYQPIELRYAKISKYLQSESQEKFKDILKKLSIEGGIAKISTSMQKSSGEYLPVSIIAFVFDTLKPEIFLLINQFHCASFEDSYCNDWLRIKRLEIDFPNILHEMKTGLGCMQAYTDLFNAEDDYDEQEKLIKEIAECALCLQKVTSNLFDTKHFSKKCEIRESIISPKCLIETIVWQLTSIAREKKILIEMDIAPDFPCCLVGDYAKMCKIFYLIIGEATLAAPKDSTVKISASVKESSIYFYSLDFTVSDMGPAIPIDIGEDIFNVQFMARDAKNVTRGKTLSLAIARLIVKAFDGKIDCTSSVEEGTKIRFSLNFKKHEKPAQPIATIRREFFDSFKDRKVNVLLVEDNKINQKVATRLFDKIGLSYVLAENGEEAIKKFSEHFFHLVITDLLMPGINGFQTAERLRELEKNQYQRKVRIPIALWSARDISDEEVEACGADVKLDKPMKMDQLVKLCNDAYKNAMDP